MRITNNPPNKPNGNSDYLHEVTQGAVPYGRLSFRLRRLSLRSQTGDRPNHLEWDGVGVGVGLDWMGLDWDGVGLGWAWGWSGMGFEFDWSGVGLEWGGVGMGWGNHLEGTIQEQV